ncbi:Interferon-induced, double-stranded RNA-activated protein kinase [Folsomia candida]|uniref:Interferon-induced, double-stranded RNA-activated protein kinase n=1 Tax=Folsomia candida TaxID=158441 RepID=A0A226ECX7_FOLCA|nr:Interferon-induced, double-stranded RNA-activated protein kinase [Folsomia candida]
MKTCTSKLTVFTLVSTTPTEDDWIRRCDQFYDDVDFVAKCSNGKIICSCVCPGKGPQKKYSPTCCPEFPEKFPTLVTISPKIEKTRQPASPLPTGNCTLYRMFNCYKNATRLCTDDGVILKSNETQTFQFANGIRSISIPSNCHVTRRIKDSMCPNTPPTEEITTSGNVNNALTINQESYECQCSKDVPTTTTSTTTETPTVITTTMIPYPEEEDNFPFGLITGIIVISIISVLALSTVLLGGYLEIMSNATKNDSLLSSSNDDEFTEENISQNCVQQATNYVNEVRNDTKETKWQSVKTLRLMSHTPLGKGSHGEVWKAECTKTGNIFAIKQINLYEAFRRSEESVYNVLKFKREISNLQSIRDDNVVRLVNFWIEDCDGRAYSDLSMMDMSETSSGRPSYIFMQMEYCHLSLKKWLTDNPLEIRDFATIKRMFLQIANGLSVLHMVKIVHRDIKPDNIMCNLTGNSFIMWKIVDLGLSVKLDKKKDEYCSVAGCELYRSPEMTLNQVDCNEKTDIFSLGLCYFEILSSPITNKVKIFDQLRRNEENDVFNDLGKGQDTAKFEQLVKKMLKISAKDRSSISDVKNVLENIC